MCEVQGVGVEGQGEDIHERGVEKAARSAGVFQHARPASRRFITVLVELDSAPRVDSHVTAGYGPCRGERASQSRR